MKYLFAFLALAASALQIATAVDRAAVKEKIHDYRVTNQNLHLDKLESEIDTLEEDFGKLGEIPDYSEIKQIKARVRNLEDAKCPEGGDHVQCGGDVPECISPLFVCDGHEDCKNGRDEDETICSEDVVKVGSSFSGITAWSDCLNHSPHMTVITITASFKPEAYTARIYVRAVVSFEVDEKSHLVQSYSAKGYWDFGHHRLVLLPQDPATGSGLGIACTFNLGSHNEADCKIGTIIAKHECAAFHATRA